MNANIRKLAFDFGFRWLVPVQLLAALLMDYSYLERPDPGIAVVGGVMLSLQAAMTTQSRVPLWRILPVSDREIGQARWWQMIGFSGAAIVLMIAAALAAHVLAAAAGWAQPTMRADGMALLNGMLLQFFYPVFLTIFSLAITFARIRRSPWAYAVTILIWAPWLLLLPHITLLPEQSRIMALGLTGVFAAIILYITTPSWPQAVIAPVQLDLGGNRVIASGRPGQGGWASLYGMALVNSLVVLIPVMAIFVAAILALNLGHIAVMQLQLWLPFIVITQITRFNTTALRVLRGLPGSAHTLTAYLFLLPLALLAMITAAYCLVLEPWLTGAATGMDSVPLAAVLLVSALVLPAAISLRQTAMNILLTFTMVLVALIQFGWSYVPSPWQDERLLAGLTLAVVTAGYVLMHGRISRGAAVYRPQRFLAARWRGKD
jgi:hypothetical protein